MTAHRTRAWMKSLGVLLFLGWCWFFSAWIHRLGTPIISTLVQEQTNLKWHQFASQILTENLSYNDLVTIDYGNDQTIRSIQVHTGRINRFKSEFIQSFLAYFQSDTQTTLRIPMGTLLGHPFLYGKGPSFCVETLPCTNVFVQIKDRFTSAGINQTLHTLYLELSAKITVLTPGGSLEYSLQEDIPLAQTWIVGKIPSIYPSDGLLT